MRAHCSVRRIVSDPQIVALEARLQALESQKRESNDAQERDELALTMADIQREIRLLLEE
jgi:hypothetical protein